jgi:hypothetical protein
MAVPSTAPPVIATLLALWVDMVPNPVISVFGIVAEAVKADVPEPLTYPVRVAAPVPPLPTIKVPANVIAPVVAVLGVKPVVPAEDESTGADVAFDANSLTVPAAFLKYSFSSWMLIANSPFARFPEVGIAAAVVLKYN